MQPQMNADNRRSDLCFIRVHLRTDKKKMKQLLAIILIAAASAPFVYSQSSKPAPQSQQQTQRLIEEFSFVLPDFKMDHQGEINTLNITISFRYVANIANSQYPDFRWLAKDVETLLNNYPNKQDYWEIVNKQVTALLLKKYPAITSVTSEFAVKPSKLVPYTRSSKATRSRPVIGSNRKRF